MKSLPGGNRAVAAIIAVFVIITASYAQLRAEGLDSLETWQWMQSNLIAQQRLLDISQAMKPEDILFRNITLVQLPEGTTQSAAAVLVKDGKIAWVGSEGDIPPSPGARKIDGRGRYLAPGITDMHVHTQNDADYLLQLSAGVTSIREMNGWDWRLARRDAVEDGRLLAPNMFVASQILNSSDFGGYALPVGTPAEARAAVVRAAVQGYDAIKIHNGLENEVFHAIADETLKVGLKLVGHIPVRVTVREAIVAGLHTAEHFKGYIDDSVLEISEEDWLNASRGTSMYLTPTFYTYREHLRGADAEAIIEREGHLVPPYRVNIGWRANAGSEADGLTRLRQTIRSKSEQIFKALLPLDLKWLAGTDAGSYELMVPGFAAIEEMEIMESLGLSTLEALKAATTNAADAMGWQDRLGRIEVGLQADLILLGGNPLQEISNLRKLEGVMVRGVWIENPAALRLSADDYATVTDDMSPASLTRGVEQAEAIYAGGYYPSHFDLEGWAVLMRNKGQEDLANRLTALRMKGPAAK